MLLVVHGFSSSLVHVSKTKQRKEGKPVSGWRCWEETSLSRWCLREEEELSSLGVMSKWSVEGHLGKKPLRAVTGRNVTSLQECSQCPTWRLMQGLKSLISFSPRPRSHCLHSMCRNLSLRQSSHLTSQPRNAGSQTGNY